MEHVDDLRNLTGLPLEQLFAEADDDMYTHFSGDVLLQDIIDFDLNVTDLYGNEDVHLVNVDWDKVDWTHVAANWHECELEWYEDDDPDMALTIKSLDKDEQAQKNNKRRRLNEVERPQKYSWERLPSKAGGKRAKYKYVHADGSTVTSLRAALDKCRKSHIACV
jgi:hypothetical protein